MQSSNWQCLRCGYDRYETDEIRTTGGALAKIFDVQNKKFSTVSCMQCHHTELYKADTSALGNIFDFFTN